MDLKDIKRQNAITILPSQDILGLIQQILLASKGFIFFTAHHLPASFFGLEGSQLHSSTVLIRVCNMLAEFLLYDTTQVGEWQIQDFCMRPVFQLWNKVVGQLAIPTGP